MLGLKIPFKKQQFEAREEAILDAVNRLLSSKGFDLMTMDDVAEAVGVAKGSLYKHFSSKEKLAGAVMVRLLQQTDAALDAMPEDWSAARKLEEILRWSLKLRMKDGVPHLPSTRGPLQTALLLNLDYLAAAIKVNRRFYALVEAAKAAGDINPGMPSDVIVYSLYARACDPTVDFLRRDKKLSEEEIIESMVSAMFAGFSTRT